MKDTTPEEYTYILYAQYESFANVDIGVLGGWGLKLKKKWTVLNSVNKSLHKRRRNGRFLKELSQVFNIALF